MEMVRENSLYMYVHRYTPWKNGRIGKDNQQIIFSDLERWCLSLNREIVGGKNTLAGRKCHGLSCTFTDNIKKLILEVH